MANNRGGLSKREYAAKASGSKLNYKTGALVKPQLKVATKPRPTSFSMNPEDAPQTTKQFESRIASGLGNPTQVAAARNEAKLTSSPSKQREAASRAQKSKKSSIPGLTGNVPSGITFGGGGTDINASLSSGGLVRGGGATELPGGGQPGIFSRLFSAISQGQAGKAKNDSMLADENAYNTPEQLAENRQQLQRNINQGLGVPGAMASNGEFGDIGGVQADTPFEINPEDAPQTTPQFEQQLASGFDQNTQREARRQSDRGGRQFQPELPPEIDYTQQQNDLYGNNAQSPVDTGGATIGNRSGRGSGAFGTGKGTMSDDPYIKELRKAYSSNGGEKWLRKQFEELIAQLDPTYAALQKEGETSLNQQLLQNNQQLASVMNANNIGYSEFRQQAMARQQTESQTALGNLLAKLSQAKAQDASGYRSKLYEGLQQNQQTNKTNQQKLMEAIQGYKDKQWDRDYKMKELGQKGGGSTKNMSLKAIGFDKFGTEKMWVDQSTGDIYDNSDFQQ